MKLKHIVLFVSYLIALIAYDTIYQRYYNSTDNRRFDFLTSMSRTFWLCCSFFAYFVVNLMKLFTEPAVFVVIAGGNPYPGLEMNETFITRLKNGYRMEKPKLAPDSVYAEFSQ